MWRKEDVIEQLKYEQGDRPLRDYATEIGCSAATLSLIYNNQRDPGEKILDHLGLEAKKVTTVAYTPKEPRKWRKT
jgi:hypothetical protein